MSSVLSLFVCNVMFLTVFIQDAGSLHHEICFFGDYLQRVRSIRSVKREEFYTT